MLRYLDVKGSMCLTTFERRRSGLLGATGHIHCTADTSRQSFALFLLMMLTIARRALPDDCERCACEVKV